MTAERETRRNLSVEQLATREKILGGEVGIITIGGDAGTGTTSAAKELRKRLGIPDTDSFLVGEAARSLESIAGNPLLDRMLDAAQENLIMKADPENPSLTESRLGPFFLYILGQVNGISIELTAPKDVRMKRLRDRAIENEIARLEGDTEKWQKAMDEHEGPPMAEDVIKENTGLIEKLKMGTAEGFTMADITRKEDARKREDIKRFKKIYPWFRDMNLKDPYYPDAVGPDGRRIYDITVPTAVFSKEQVIEELFRRIIAFRQSAEYQSRRRLASPFPQSRVVFESNATSA